PQTTPPTSRYVHQQEMVSFEEESLQRRSVPENQAIENLGPLQESAPSRVPTPPVQDIPAPLDEEPLTSDVERIPGAFDAPATPPGPPTRARLPIRLGDEIPLPTSGGQAVTTNSGAQPKTVTLRESQRQKERAEKAL